MRVLLAAVVIVALALTGCSGKIDLNAEQVTAQLKQAGLPVANVAVYTAKTDPNKLLGRSNGYASKTAFDDTRVDLSKFQKGEVPRGGGVEVFDTADAAQRRGEYIAKIQQASSLLGSEYLYTSGPVLLRISGELTPEQAKGYANALADITSADVAPVEP